MCLVLWLPSVAQTQTLQEGTLPNIRLKAGTDGPPLAPYIRYVRNYEGQIASDDWDEIAPNPSALTTSKIQFGPGGQRILVLLNVRNQGSSKGTWLLTTKRGALKDFELAERVDGETRLLIDGSNIEQVRDILQSFHGFAQIFELEPGETRSFAISFQGVHSTLLPLNIQTAETFAKERYQNVAISAGGFVGTLTLVIIGVMFYAATGKLEFLWLGLAELMLAAYLLHVPGYTTFYFLYDKGDWIYAVGIILPCAYAFLFAQFARVFLDTPANFPLVNKILIGAMALWAFVAFRRIYLVLTGMAQDGGWLGMVTILAVILNQILLPIVAFLAVFRLSRHYWPLLVAWTGWMLFNGYGLASTLGYISGLPYNWHFTGIAALFTALFSSLALALHIRRVHLDKLDYEQGLNKSLQQQIEIQEDAIRLEREKASAIATINDQDNLIHASGHDSQQVLLALKSIVSFTDSMGTKELPDNFSKILKSSAAHLQDIISTTTSGSISGSENAEFVALSRFRIDNLINPLEMIYRPLFQKKGLTFTIDVPGETRIVSDRALLARVLSNLLSNSLKFTQKGDVSITVRDTSGSIVFSVADTGSGMEPALLEKVNDQIDGRLKTTDEEGTGFGLISARKIIRQLCGEMSVSSAVEKGTTITLDLPFAGSRKQTQLSIPEIQSGLPEHHVLDADHVNRTAEGMVAIDTGDGRRIMPVTYDPSASMRRWASEYSNIILLKPVYPDTLAHPALAIDIRQRQDA